MINTIINFGQVIYETFLVIGEKTTENVDGQRDKVITLGHPHFQWAFISVCFQSLKKTKEIPTKKFPKQVIP